MKYNREYSSDELIESNKTKFLFIGFIVGISPYIILIFFIALKEGGFEYIPTILKETLIIAGIITASINSMILKRMYVNKMNSSLN